MTRFLNIACIILLGSEPYIAILNAIKKEHIYSYMKNKVTLIIHYHHSMSSV